MALLTALLCAVVLGSFAMAAWWKLRNVRMEALDRELESAGVSLALSARSALTSAAAGRQLDQRFGTERQNGCAFAISSRGGKSVLSANWPPGFDPDNLPRRNETFEHMIAGTPDDEPSGARGGPPPNGFGPPPDGPVGPPEGGRNDRRPPPHDAGGARERPGRPLLYQPALSTVEAGGKVWRAGVFGHAGSGIVIRVLLDMDTFAADLRETRQAFLLAVPGALVLIAAGAWFAARRSLAPVEQLTGRIETLSLTKLNERLDSAGTDNEYSRIIAAYNDMLGRLERSYQQATRFSADASHELKTPLAVMRATVEQGMRECRDGSGEQRTYAGLLDEMDQIQAIIEGLLLLSRADAGLLATSRETLDLSAWLLPLMEDAGLMAEERGLTIATSLAPDISVQADPVLLYRAIHNLLRNAVAYNHDGGEIRCSLTKENNIACLRIANSGPSVPEAERDRIFDRFMRGANAGGNGHGKGLGIGLSLAREIALAHGGSLALEDGPPGLTTFALSLPAGRLSNRGTRVRTAEQLAPDHVDAGDFPGIIPD